MYKVPIVYIVFWPSAYKCICALPSALKIKFDSDTVVVIIHT